MAKKVATKKVAKKRVKATHSVGQAPVVLALEVQRNLLRMRHRWQPRLPQKPHLYMV